MSPETTERGDRRVEIRANLHGQVECMGKTPLDLNLFVEQTFHFQPLDRGQLQ